MKNSKSFLEKPGKREYNTSELFSLKIVIKVNKNYGGYGDEIQKNNCNHGCGIDFSRQCSCCFLQRQNLSLLLPQQFLWKIAKVKKIF